MQRPASAKNYVLDTNVLVHDPSAILSFKENQVLIPIEVIEEIDRFKRETSERGQSARAHWSMWSTATSIVSGSS